MNLDGILSRLSEGTILEGPHWTEPVRVLTAKARGSRIEVQAVGLNTKRLWNKLLKAEDFETAIKITWPGNWRPSTATPPTSGLPPRPIAFGWLTSTTRTSPSRFPRSIRCRTRWMPSTATCSPSPASGS